MHCNARKQNPLRLTSLSCFLLYVKLCLLRIIISFLKLDNSSSALELDDITFSPYACNSPIDCTFSEIKSCNWIEETSQNTLLWSIGPGRVMNPSNINTTTIPELDGQTLLYTDFTNIKNFASMELMSSFAPSTTKNGGLCVEMNFFVSSIHLDTDAFYLDQIDIKGKYEITANFL